MKFKAMTIRVIRELVRDKRSLALMFLAPILVLTLMDYVFSPSSNSKVNIGFDSSVKTGIIENIPEDNVNIISVDYVEDIKNTLENQNLDAFISEDNYGLNIIYKNEDPARSLASKQIISATMQKNKMQEIQKLITNSVGNINTSNQLEIKESYIYGNENSTYFDKMFPILIGFFVFLFVFLISGISLLKERTSGTLERLLATPIKRSEIILGYLFGYGIFAIVQTLFIVYFSIYLLDINIAGNTIWVLLINILIAFSALAMGIFISTFANTEFQMIQFIPIIIAPQIFFSGIMSLENINKYVAGIGYFFPLRYAGDALTKVIIKAQSFSHFYIEILILIGFILIFTVLNIIGLKKHRKI